MSLEPWSRLTIRIFLMVDRLFLFYLKYGYVRRPKSWKGGNRKLLGEAFVTTSCYLLSHIPLAGRETIVCQHTKGEYMEKDIIHNMDCIAGMSLIPDGEVDMILTDLPYGVTSCVWDSLLPLGELWEQFNRVLKPNGAAVFTACQPFTTKLINSNPKTFKYCWYWHKNIATGFCFAKFQPRRCMEDIVVFYRHMPTYNPQGLKKQTKNYLRVRKENGDCIYKTATLEKPHIPRFTNYPMNLLEFKAERGFHPTQKPVSLFEYLIKTYTNKGDTVLDCCMGSGTTAIACINTERHYIGFEIDQTFYEISLERIRKRKDYEL